MKTYGWILALVLAFVGPTSAALGQYISGSGTMPVLLANRDDSGRIFLWDETGGLRTGWPVAASGAWPAGTPRLQDLDGDGQPEVVCLMKSSTGGKSVRAWRLDGQPCPGHESCAAPASMAETPLLGPVDSAGNPSWVWPTTQCAVAVSPPGDPTHPRPGFPYAMSGGRLRLRLADLDGDGVMEVLGGVEDGATGQWFILHDKGGIQTLYFVDQPAPVTAAPAAAQLLSDAPLELLLSMSDRMECRVSDGHGGYSVAPGWPVATPAIRGGDLTLVTGPGRWAVARGVDGGMQAFSDHGQAQPISNQERRLGEDVSSADLPAPSGQNRWAMGGARTTFRFENFAGTDSAGRFRLLTQELGDRHHGVHVSAPAGLLPSAQCRIWLNGNLTPRTGPPPVVAPGEIVVRGGWIDAQPASRPDLVLALTRAGRPVASARGPMAAELRLTLEPGTYSALLSSAADTMTRLGFEVQSTLALSEVYSFPNPMRERMEFLFTLSRPADVTTEIYTVAGRKLRTLRGSLEQGRQSVVWDGRDGSGRPVANGVYLYRLSAVAGGNRTGVTGKLIRLN